MIANLPLAGAILVAALPLALIALGLLHLMHAKVKAMSLSNPLLIEILDAVKAEAAPLLARAEQAEAALAAALGDKSSLETELADLKAELVAAVTPAPAPAPAAEPATEEHPAS